MGKVFNAMPKVEREYHFLSPCIGQGPVTWPQLSAEEAGNSLTVCPSEREWLGKQLASLSHSLRKMGFMTRVERFS